MDASEIDSFTIPAHDPANPSYTMNAAQTGTDKMRVNLGLLHHSETVTSVEAHIGSRLYADFHDAIASPQLMAMNTAGHARDRAHTLDAWSDIIRRAAAIGIDKFVVHAGGEPIDAADRPARMQHACTSLAHMADVAAQCGAVICIEDLPRTCLGHSIAEMQTLVAADPRLRVCIDTNHVTVEPPEALIRALGDRLVTLHVSDFDFVNERHWLPGEGKIAWPRVLDALRAVDYRGVWLYEIGFACPKTIFRDRPLTCADFARNAQELFAGKAPTVFSTPKPNLGMWE